MCKNDFIIKTENLGRKKQGKREYLNDKITSDLMNKLEPYFESTVEIPRITVGKQQSIETLINEEVLIFGKYLRNKSEIWIPRIAVLSQSM